MVAPHSTWSAGAETDPRRMREHRSGLSGLGDRPVLHPAWRAPDDEAVREALPTRRRGGEAAGARRLVTRAHV